MESCWGGKLITVGIVSLLPLACGVIDTDPLHPGDSSETTESSGTTDPQEGTTPGESSSSSSPEDSGTTLAEESSTGVESTTAADGSTTAGGTSETSSDSGTTGNDVCGDEDVGSASPASVVADASGDEWTGSCGVAGTDDYAVQWTAPVAGTFVFATRWPGTDPEFDTHLYVIDGCGGSELACDDNSGSFDFSALALELAADQLVTVVVDGAVLGEPATFELVILPAPAPVDGGSCCETSSAAGCDVPAIEACVCAFDDYCCYAEWDGQCTGHALLCAAMC